MTRTAIGTNDTRLTPFDTGFTRVDNVTYSGTQLVDICSPNVPNRPALILLHGGRWTTGARTDLGGLFYRRLAACFAEYGFAVFNADYRYAPPGTAQDPIDDALALVRWVRNNAATYNADASRVGAMGLSAGAHLVLMAGITGVAGDTRPDAVAPWSAAIDFFNSAPLAHDTILAYTGAADFTDVTTISHYSPLQRLVAEGTCCPMRICGSTDEALTGWLKLANFTDLYAQAVALGIPATIRIFTGTRHAFFDGMDTEFYAGVGSSLDENGQTANDIPGTCQWLRSTLGEVLPTGTRSAASGRTASIGRVAA